MHPIIEYISWYSITELQMITMKVRVENDTFPSVFTFECLASRHITLIIKMSLPLLPYTVSRIN